MSKRTERNKYFYRQSSTRLRDFNDTQIRILSRKTIADRMPRKARKAYSKREIEKLFKMLEEIGKES